MRAEPSIPQTATTESPRSWPGRGDDPSRAERIPSAPGSEQSGAEQSSPPAEPPPLSDGYLDIGGKPKQCSVCDNEAKPGNSRCSRCIEEEKYPGLDLGLLKRRAALEAPRFA